MPLGCHGLVWTGGTSEAQLQHALRHNQEAGFELLEIALLDPHGFDVRAAHRALATSHQHVSASLGLPAAADISSGDPGCLAAGEALLNRAVEIVHDLGGRYLVGVLYSQLRKYSAPATAEGRCQSQDVLRRVAARATQLGVTLALEVVNRYETNVFNTARGALAYLDELGDPSVKVHLDTYHMNIEETDLLTPVLECGDRLGYVHIGESHRGYLGTGSVDFDGFFTALSLIDYRGPITFESFSTAVVNQDLSRNLAIWRNLWFDSDDLAKHAHTFISGQLHARSQTGRY